jgi:hypothetical protein
LNALLTLPMDLSRGVIGLTYNNVSAGISHFLLFALLVEEEGKLPGTSAARLPSLAMSNVKRQMSKVEVKNRTRKTTTCLVLNTILMVHRID